MSTATFSPIAGRFAWKEYRTLRGLWLAVLVVGVLVQLLSRALAAPGTVLPPIMFGVALGACILYAVAAAAILFSVEHEEETYQFLSGLPVRWLPMTAGKLIVAATSALALAIVLAFAGWFVAGGEWPSTRMTSELVSLLGVGILEALTWATLFSLLVKRPLTAVALALVVGTLVIQLASATMALRPDGLADLDTYSRAVPLRLAIVAVVALGIAVVARRWLGVAKPQHASHQSSSATLPSLQHLASSIACVFAPDRTFTTPSLPMSRVAMLTRLLWHAWRQSWKLLLIPFAVTAGLWLGAALLTALAPQPADKTASLIGAGAFILPALFGALVFSGDQRRRQFRYLAEHAARPRYVWLTRHIVWLGTMIGVSLGCVLVVSLLTSFLLNLHIQAALEIGHWLPPESYEYQIDMGTIFFIRGTSLVGFGILAAYAVGQMCSMVFRSEIIAAFLSVLLSVLVTAWALVLLACFLSGWWFMAPIALGFLLATWLRVPDWIIERNSWQAWLKPTLAVVVPMVIIGLLLPRTRLAQVPDRGPAVEQLITQFRAGDTPAARETAAMYERALVLRDSWKETDLLERWSGPEFAQDGGMLGYGEMYEHGYMDGYGGRGEIGGIDEKKIPTDQLDEYHAAIETQRKLMDDAWASAAKLTVEASLRTDCRFDVDWSSTTIPTSYGSNYGNRENSWRQVHSTFSAAMDLAENMASFWSLATTTVDQLAAAVRMCDHFRQGQPTAVAVRTFALEQGILRSIARWAGRDDVTTDQLRDLKRQLELYFQQSAYEPQVSLAADHLLVRDVLEDNAVPLVFDERPLPWSDYLAYLANQLPWERERAIKALGAITRQNVSDVNQFQEYLNRGAHPGTLRPWLRPNVHPQLSPAWLSEQFLASTSYLTRFEYEERVPINEFYAQLAKVKMSRRAFLIQLALLIYHRDHDEYPAALSELVPDYLNKLPMDPYSNQPFYYSPGLDLPLRPRSYTDYETIPPHTPVVWSVGPNGVQLTRYETGQVIGGDDPGVEPREVPVSVYTLFGRDKNWVGESDLVFPLPKLPAKSPKLPPP
ncbi:MAG: hypothetical protein WD971_03665 [Pirellulales bacterium]